MGLPWPGVTLQELRSGDSAIPLSNGILVILHLARAPCLSRDL